MKRVLLTGMSGTGKSSVIRALASLGHPAYDADEGGFSHYIDARTGRPAAPPRPGEPMGDREFVWDEARIAELLSRHDSDFLFLSGCSPNQGKFYDRFDHVILLSAPKETIMERLRSRDTNPYGKLPADLERVLADIEETEPLLRRGASLEIDTSAPLADVVAAVLRHVGAEAGPRSR